MLCVLSLDSFTTRASEVQYSSTVNGTINIFLPSSSSQAVRDGKRDLVFELLECLPKESRKLNELDKDGFAAIHYAARFNRHDIMKQLLSALPGVCMCVAVGVGACVNCVHVYICLLCIHLCLFVRVST